MKKLFILVLMLAILTPTTIMAADEYTLLEPLPCIEGTGNNCAPGATSTATMNLETYIGYIFKFAIAIAAFLAVVMIIYGGFEIMLSEAVSSKLDGKSKIYNALTGLLLVLASYLILRTIDPRLVEINTSITPIDTTRLIAEMQDFHKKLNEDISNSVRLSNANSTAYQERLDYLNNYKQQLEDSLALNTLSANEREFFQDGLRQTNQSINTVTSERNLSIANSSGLAYYARASTIINNPNPDESDLATINSELLDRAGDIRNTDLYRTYEARIVEAQTRGNQAEVDTLRRQRMFLREQVLEESAVKRSIDLAQNTIMEEKLQTYKSQLNNPTQIEGTGISPSLYATMLQTRIDQLNKALNK